MIKLKRETVEELGIILKEEFNRELDSKQLESFAYDLVGYFEALIKVANRHEFGNHPISLIDGSVKKIKN